MGKSEMDAVQKEALVHLSNQHKTYKDELRQYLAIAPATLPILLALLGFLISLFLQTDCKNDININNFACVPSFFAFVPFFFSFYGFLILAGYVTIGYLDNHCVLIERKINYIFGKNNMNEVYSGEKYVDEIVKKSRTVFIFAALLYVIVAFGFSYLIFFIPQRITTWPIWIFWISFLIFTIAFIGLTLITQYQIGQYKQVAISKYNEWVKEIEEPNRTV